MAGAPLNPILDLDSWRKQKLVVVTDCYATYRQRTWTARCGPACPVVRDPPPPTDCS